MTEQFVNLEKLKELLKKYSTGEINFDVEEKDKAIIIKAYYDKRGDVESREKILEVALKEKGIDYIKLEGWFDVKVKINEVVTKEAFSRLIKAIGKSSEDE